MKVLVLSPYPIRLSKILRRHGDTVYSRNDSPSAELFDTTHYDFAVSFGYSYIIPSETTKAWDGQLINLHISLLPWNRGSDPNFWSFFDRTPKGVSIHYIDSGLDTGDLIAQREVAMSRDSSLATSYAELQNQLLDLFDVVWPTVRAGRAPRYPQPPGGSVHRKSDIKPYLSLLHRGWDTPVIDVERAGRETQSVS